MRILWEIIIYSLSTLLIHCKFVSSINMTLMRLHNILTTWISISITSSNSKYLGLTLFVHVHSSGTLVHIIGHVAGHGACIKLCWSPLQAYVELLCLTCVSNSLCCVTFPATSSSGVLIWESWLDWSVALKFVSILSVMLYIHVHVENFEWQSSQKL